MTKSYSSYKELCWLLDMKVSEARRLHLNLSHLREILRLETRDYPEGLTQRAREIIYNY